jgi:hypothetical protein
MSVPYLKWFGFGRRGGVGIFAYTSWHILEMESKCKHEIHLCFITQPDSHLYNVFSAPAFCLWPVTLSQEVLHGIFHCGVASVVKIFQILEHFGFEVWGFLYYSQPVIIRRLLFARQATSSLSHIFQILPTLWWVTIMIPTSQIRNQLRRTLGFAQGHQKSQVNTEPGSESLTLSPTHYCLN